MPIYAYKCAECDSAKDDLRSIAERHNGPECCGEPMKLQIVPTHVCEDMKPYYCHATGQMVTSRRHRRDVIARNDLVPVG